MLNPAAVPVSEEQNKPYACFVEGCKKRYIYFYSLLQFKIMFTTISFCFKTDIEMQMG